MKYFAKNSFFRTTLRLTLLEQEVISLLSIFLFSFMLHINTSGQYQLNIGMLYLL